MARRQRDAGRRDRLDRGLEALHLAFGARPVLRRLQVGPQARDTDGRTLGEPGGNPGDRIEREPAAAEAGFDLELHPEDRRASGAARSRSRSTGSPAVTSIGVLPRDVQPRPGNRIQDEDRQLDAGLAQFEPLVDRRNAQPVGAGRLEGRGDRHRAVSVGVGLHHRADRHARPGKDPQRREIGGQRVQVELEPRGPWQRRQAGSRQARLDRGLDRLPGHAGPGSVASWSRTVKPTRLPPLRRSAMPASLRRDVATGSGRSEASRPASPNRSRTCSPASPCR